MGLGSISAGHKACEVEYMGHVARLASSAGQRVISFYRQRFGHPAQSSANRANRRSH
jgi:hypothetical protein